MSISSAIGSERRSRVSGYIIKKGFFDNSTGNLPQTIVVLGEANTANQAGLVTTKKEITSADEAGLTYGYGSPIHQIMRILRPISGDGVGGIPTIVIPQTTAVGATATVIEWTITGNATKNATHTLIVNGRESLDFNPYTFNIAIGDTPTMVAQKAADAINNVPSCPFSATIAAGVISFTTKWKGLTAANGKVTISNNGNTAGLAYALTETTLGTGAVSLATALDQFENDWFTGVINAYGEATLSDLEQFNGFPDNENPTGRYQGRIFKPFMAFFGSTLSDKDDLALITNDEDRIGQCTNVLCPAPGSDGFPYEAAANMMALFARIMQDTPHLDVNGKYYPDMPTPASGVIGDMSDYNNRDFLLKKGCSTVMLVQGAYQVQDLVTTYHPLGESVPQFNYCRNLNLDWNVKDGYSILEERHVKDHVLVKDNQVTDASKAVKPKEWKAILNEYFNDLSVKAILADAAFSQASLRVEISTENPNRFETSFRYQRTGIARIQSTTAEVVV